MSSLCKMACSVRCGGHAKRPAKALIERRGRRLSSKSEAENCCDRQASLDEGPVYVNVCGVAGPTLPEKDEFHTGV